MYPSALLSRVKNFFLIFLLLSVCVVSHTSTASAQTSSIEYTSQQASSNQHFRAQTVIYDTLSAISCLLSGIDPINKNGCVVYSEKTQTYSYATSEKGTPQIGGLLGLATNSFGQLYQIPISDTAYVKYVADNFGITHHAYAADNQGFNQINGVLSAWTVMRNISYLFFVLIFVIIGMGVMLRIKIDPRTVMTIQNQIPKLIVSLILITFSYAIVGFMIDVMWTTTYLTVRLAGQVKLLDKPGTSVLGWTTDATSRSIDQKKVTDSLLSSPFGFGNTVLGAGEGGGLIGFAGSITGTIGEMVAKLITPLAGSQNEECVLTHPWIFVGTDKTFASCVRGAIYGAIAWITEFLGYFVVLFAILIALGRIWWSLIKSFAYILIYTTFGPIYIAGGLFPGSTLGFGPWFRGLVANLAVYPATVGAFLLSYIFLASFDSSSFSPPLVGNPAANAGFGYIAAFAILMVTPELIWMLRDSLKAPANKYIAPAIQSGFSRGGILPGAIVSKSWGRAFKFDPNGRGIGGVNTFLQNRRDNLMASRNPVLKGIGWAAGAIAGKRP